MKTLKGENFYSPIILTSVFTIGIYLLTVGLHNVSEYLYLVGLLFFCIFFLMGGNGYYFEVHENKIIIKHRFWFWVIKQYYFNEIIEVVQHSSSVYASGLLINTKTNSNYFPSSLTLGELEEMKSLLWKYNISFR